MRRAKGASSPAGRTAGQGPSRTARNPGGVGRDGGAVQPDSASIAAWEALRHPGGVSDDPFAAVAPVYENWYETPLGRHVDREELALLRRLVAREARRLVVEVGAGTGHVARVFARDGARVLAVEPSRAMRSVGVARSAGLPIEWVAAYGESLPLRSRVADGALIVATLEFVSDPRRVLAEASRVVRPGGWLLVGWLEARSSWVAAYRLAADRGEAPWTAARFFTREKLIELVGREPEAYGEAVWAGPLASEPLESAEEAGRRSGHPPAFAAARWRVGGP